MSGLASRLYRGDAGLQIVPRRKLWFGIAAGIVLVAIASFLIQGFHLSVDFTGGTTYSVPASVGELEDARDRAGDVVERAAPGMEITSAQEVGRADGTTYLFRVGDLTTEQSAQVKAGLGEAFNLPPADISDNQVSAAWGDGVTQRALLALVVFVGVVLLYLVLRFEWRMAVAAVAALLLDLMFTAAVYSLVGFEVTPSTVIGFLTILGFALYDVVVVFDKIQENTRGITARSSETYAEAANLATNQTLMRSINTSVVALLPVGGLLFIGAGLLGVGTLKDLGLVLFVGMAAAFFSSIFFATPLLVSLKEREPRIKAHGQRVLARRAGIRSGDVAPRGERNRSGATAVQPEEVAALAAGTPPRPGARPAAKRSTNRGGRPGGAGNRPSGGSKRR
jgi:preprotein translocase subunit SecF